MSDLLVVKSRAEKEEFDWVHVSFGVLVVVADYLPPSSSRDLIDDCLTALLELVTTLASAGPCDVVGRLLLTT